MERDRPQIKTKHGAERIRFVCRITKTIIQTHKLIIVSTYWFSMATVVTRIAPGCYVLHTYIVCLVTAMKTGMMR